VIRSKPYLTALLLAAVLGVPISAVAYGFLALVDALQEFVFDDLPRDIVDGSVPAWWPVPWLLLCGLLTGLSIRYLPGNGGHSPALGFAAGGGPPKNRELEAENARLTKQLAEAELDKAMLKELAEGNF
jgi:hypothetical protein